MICSSADALAADKARMEDDNGSSGIGKTALVEDGPEQASTIAKPHGDGLVEDGLAPVADQQPVVIVAGPEVPAPAGVIDECENTDGTEATHEQSIEVPTNTNIQDLTIPAGPIH